MTTCTVEFITGGDYDKSFVPTTAGWQNGIDNRAAGGSGGATGSASTGSSANAVAVAWPTQGKGTEDNPYIINSTDDWNGFANAVTGGCTFSGQYVQMNSNISVSAMVGADETNSFQGTFLGDGHTLTVNYNTSAESTAPFRFARNAVIKNLHVDGTIATSAKFAGGIVGKSSGTLNITGCRSSVSINSSVSGDGTHGGIVARIAGGGNTIIIDGCVFDGSFATTASTNNCGGFIGWPVTDTPTITNSLMKPSSVDAGMLTNTFARWYTGDGGIYEPTITNCYYVATTNLPTDQGTEAVATDTAPANLGSLVEDYGMVKAYQNGILVGGTYYVAPASITLADNADNNTSISNANGYVANVTLSDRTLYKDGAWNTICLPFDVTIAGSPLAGATARPLTSASISGTTLTLTFGDAETTLEAGTPYIIKWAKADGYDEASEETRDLKNPVFSGVTIDSDMHPYDTAEESVTTDERVRFVGTYKSTAFNADDKSILLMGSENTLYYPTAGAGIGAQRAYFKIGSDGALLARRLTAFNIDFGDDETTGIISVHDSGFMVNGSDAWFTLDGRRLSAKPSVKGVYVNNGRKVVIK